MALSLLTPSNRLKAGLAFGIGVAGYLAAASPALALTAPAIYGTGVSATGQTTTKPTGNVNGADVNWQVIQYPNNFGTPGTAAAVTANTPAVWIGSDPGATQDDNNGATIDGTTFRWISPSTGANAASYLVPGNPLTPASINGVGTFSYILKQVFNVTDAGNYQLSLDITGDNEAFFYINGSIIDGNTDTPGISGGTLIGTSDSTPGNLGRTARISSMANLSAGLNTAYIVVRDSGAFTGILTSNVTFTPDVPGPLPLLGASAAFGWSRRLRRRINGNAAVIKSESIG